VEKNFTSSLNREDNKPFSLGRRETQKITWSYNPSIKVTLFCSRHESKKATGTEYYAWTCWRTQEAGKTTDAIAWQHQGSNRPTIERPKRSSRRYEKNGVRWWKKRLGIEYAQMWSEFRRRQWQTTPVQLNLPRKFFRKVTSHQESKHTRRTATNSASMENLHTGECPVTSVECCWTWVGDGSRHRFRCEVELFLVAEKHICCQVQEGRKLKVWSCEW
jgi:hypothetical protein